MKYLLLVILAIGSAHASTKVEVKNNRITVQENGIRQGYGTVRKVETTPSGQVKIYSNKNFSGAAVTIDRFGNTDVQRYNKSSVSSCTYNCQLDLEDEEDEE